LTGVWSEDSALTVFIDKSSDLIWGSSFYKEGNADYHRSKDKVEVSVPTIGLGKWLVESFDESDYVIVKIDVEGAEFAVVESLIETEAYKLIDQLLVEWHSQYEGQQPEGRKRADLEKKLRSLGAKYAEYDSPT